MFILDWIILSIYSFYTYCVEDHPHLFRAFFFFFFFYNNYGVCIVNLSKFLLSLCDCKIDWITLQKKKQKMCHEFQSNECWELKPEYTVRCSVSTLKSPFNLWEVALVAVIWSSLRSTLIPNWISQREKKSVIGRNSGDMKQDISMFIQMSYSGIHHFHRVFHNKIRKSSMSVGHTSCSIIDVQHSWTQREKYPFLHFIFDKKSFSCVFKNAEIVGSSACYINV